MVRGMKDSGRQKGIRRDRTTRARDEGCQEKEGEGKVTVEEETLESLY
jgi:hypothetical protein